MTNHLTQDLGGVVRLLEDMTPGDLIVYDANEGDGWPPRPLWCFKNEAYDSGEEPALQGSIHYGGKEDAEAIAAAVNFLRTNSDEIAGALRDADGWQPIESAPSEVPADDAVLVCVTYDEPRFASQRIVGEAYKIDGIWWWAGTHPDQYVTDPIEDSYGIDCVTHWRPLPAPPAQDSAMQQGGGGGDG